MSAHAILGLRVVSRSVLDPTVCMADRSASCAHRTRAAMAKAEYKILMKCSQDFEEEERTISIDAEDAAEELSADVSAHLRDG